MSNSKNKVLPNAVMNRVRACATIFMASQRAQRIAQIAEAKGISLEEAAIMYTIGALKRAKRQGTARNYTDALEKLEAEQVGDRGNQITKTISADKLSRTVSRINRINEGERFSIDGIHYVHDYDLIATVDGKKEAIPHFEIVEKEKSDPKPSKVLGTLYVEWEEKEKKSDPLECMINDSIDRNLQLFFADYTSRLSKTAKKRLFELAESKTDPAYLMGKGKTDPKVKREAWGAYTLYSGFPHKESISGVEFVDLVRQYVTPPAPVMA